MAVSLFCLLLDHAGNSDPAVSRSDRERSVILTSGNVLRPPLADLKATAETESPEVMTLERNHIRKILERTRSVIAGPNGAAARLGVKRSTLYSRMQKLGISRPKSEPIPAY